jgi:hypothetical protein
MATQQAPRRARRDPRPSGTVVPMGLPEPLALRPRPASDEQMARVDRVLFPIVHPTLNFDDRRVSRRRHEEVEQLADQLIRAFLDES